MKRKVLYTLDLTTKNNLVTGFQKKHKDITCQELAKAVKNVLESLRRKAKVRGWTYVMYGVVSNFHVSQHRKGAYHVHLLFYGSPCSAIVDVVRKYWIQHHYGNAVQQSYKKCWDGGKMDYIKKHKEMAKLHHQEIKDFCQQVGVSNDELGVEVINKKNVWEFFSRWKDGE